MFCCSSSRPPPIPSIHEQTTVRKSGDTGGAVDIFVSVVGTEGPSLGLALYQEHPWSRISCRAVDRRREPGADPEAAVEPLKSVRTRYKASALALWAALLDLSLVDAIECRRPTKSRCYARRLARRGRIRSAFQRGRGGSRVGSRNFPTMPARQSSSFCGFPESAIGVRSVRGIVRRALGSCFTARVLRDRPSFR